MRKTGEKHARRSSGVKSISVIYSFKQEQFMNTVFKDAIVAADNFRRADVVHTMQSCAEGR